jgi:hypothetical protein
VRPAPTARRETFAAVAFEAALAGVHLRLRSRDERWQTVDAAIVCDHRLRMALRLKLRLLALLAVMLALARLMLIALLIVLPVTLMVAGIVVSLREWLLLHRNETRLLPEAGEAVVVLAVIGSHFGLKPRLRLVLPELLLGGRDQTKIVLGVLIIILGGHRVAGRARIARQLHIFFSDVGCGTADLDVRPVRLEYPSHRVLPSAVVVIVIVVPVAHPFVVLTVSHVVPLFQP